MASSSEEFLAALETKRSDFFVEAFVLDRVPHVFGGDREGYLQWKIDLGRRLDVDPAEIVVVGSGGAGLSLNPHKNFRPFDMDSDIDVAVISAHHFEVGWRWLRSLGARFYALPFEVQQVVKAHQDLYIYWGAIATDRLLAHLPFGSTWLPLLSEVSGKSPADGREVNVRLYRDWAALRDYQVRNARRLRSARLGEKES